MRGIHQKGMRGKSNAITQYLLNITLFKSKKFFIRLYIERINPSVSNGLYFLTLPLVSVMRVIYTSKGMSKKFGVRVIYQVRVIYRKIRYLKLLGSVSYIVNKFPGYLICLHTAVFLPLISLLDPTVLAELYHVVV